MAKQKGGKKNKAEAVEQEAYKKLGAIIENAGYKLWDIVYEKEGAMWYLKVLFDRQSTEDGGLSDTECEEMTAPINAAVDTLSCIDLIDVLEVGSPGLNRVLRHAEHFSEMRGEKIKFTVKDTNGKDIYLGGELIGYDEVSDMFTVNIDGEEKSFNRAKAGRIITDL